MTDSELIKILGGISFQAVEEIKGLIDERNSLRQQLAESEARVKELEEAVRALSYGNEHNYVNYNDNTVLVGKVLGILFNGDSKKEG